MIVRRLFLTHLHVGKVLVHAFGTDAMAEIQCAVLHQELFDWLPKPFPVTNRFAVAAGGDQALGVMHWIASDLQNDYSENLKKLMQYAFRKELERSQKPNDFVSW